MAHSVHGLCHASAARRRGNAHAPAPSTPCTRGQAAGRELHGEPTLRGKAPAAKARRFFQYMPHLRNVLITRLPLLNHARENPVQNGVGEEFDMRPRLRSSSQAIPPACGHTATQGACMSSWGVHAPYQIRLTYIRSLPRSRSIPGRSL